MPHKDKDQKNAYHRAYREAHKGVIHARVVACNKRARHERYAKIQALKEASPCTDCGQKYPYFVMDFDHRDPTLKVAGVATLVKRYGPQLMTEIAKCDLVCANCHRARTYKGENSYRTRRYEHHRAVLDELKSTTPCLDCGGSYKPCQMDFDHLDPKDKTANIARLVEGTSEALLKELGKCHLVCANCHRVRGHTGVRPEALEHSVKLVMLARALLETLPVPEDKRFAAFPLPHLLGKVADKELAAKTGISREMVAWYRRKAGIMMTRQGEVLS